MVTIEEARRQVEELEEKVNRLGQRVSYHDFVQMNRLLTKTLSVIQRLTAGNESLQDLINLAQRAITVANQLRITLLAIQAASGPVGWALAGIGAVSSLLITGEFVGDLTYDMNRGKM